MKLLNKAGISLVRFLLNAKTLSLTDRNELITCVLDKLNALPLRDIIRQTEQGTLEIDGKELDVDKLIQLKEYANTALDNPAAKYVKEHVAYVAVVGSVHKAVTPEQLYFFRAALWWGEEEERFLKMLSGRE